jgi:hypothetical protein
MATGMELVAGILWAVDKTAEWIDEAPDRAEAKRLAADSVRAAELLTTLHIEDFPREEAPVPQSGPRRWQNAWFIDENAQAAVDEAHAQAQARWELLLAHDQSAVITNIEAAFADNASHSACIDAGASDDGPYVTLVVHYPGPEIAEGLVQKGTTVRPRSPREKIDLYRRALASTVIATAKEALCCAPAATHAHVVVLRYDLRRKLMKRQIQLDAIYTGSFHRGLLDVKWKGWNKQNPVDTLRRAWGVRINQAHDGSFKPLGRLAGQDLRRLVEEIAAATITDQQPTS